MAATIGVVATTLDGTHAALVAAKQRAQVEGSRVVVLVPAVSGAHPSRDRLLQRARWLAARYEQAARDVGQPVQVRICAAADDVSAARFVSPADGVLFVGGSVRRLWPSAEQRLAWRLRRAGHNVVFIGCHSEDHRG